jgi:hypothetical protein
VGGVTEVASTEKETAQTKISNTEAARIRAAKL